MKKQLSVILLSLAMFGTVQANETVLGTTSAPVEKAKTIDDVLKSDSEMFKNEPLTTESRQMQQESIKRLKAKYLDVGNYNQKELFELFTAFISFGHNEAADLILNNKNVKIDVNAFNENGVTPLMQAAIAPIKGGNVEYAKKLIDLGADVNKSSVPGEFSPISMATNVNNYKVVAYLILKGALFMKKDKLDYMPIDYALRNNSVESAAILKEALSVKLKEVNNK